jgi:hypothetical protein
MRRPGRPTICSDEVDAGGFRTGPPSKTRHVPRRWKSSLFCCYPPRLKPRRNFADSAPRKKWRLLAGSSSGMPSHPSSTLWEMGPQTGPGASLEIARFCLQALRKTFAARTNDRWSPALMGQPLGPEMRPQPASAGGKRRLRFAAALRPTLYHRLHKPLQAARPPRCPPRLSAGDQLTSVRKIRDAALARGVLPTAGAAWPAVNPRWRCRPAA